MRQAMVLLVAAGCVLSGCGGGGFSVFDEPYWQDTDAVVTDADGDGRADLISLSSRWEDGTQKFGRLRVHRQSGGGTFAPPQDTIVGTYPWSVTLDDMDGNRFLDAVVTHPVQGEISILFQDGGNPGSFLPEQKVAVAGSPYSAAIADLNGDAREDIAAGNNQAAGGLTLLFQDPGTAGQFGAPVPLPLGRSVEHVVAGDLNGDGRADLALSASIFDPGTQVAQVWVGLLFQQAGGGLGAPVYLGPVTGRYVQDLHVVDFDGDGAQDLVVIYGIPPGGGQARISVYLQGAVAGQFDPPIDTDAGPGAESTVLADLDDDGHPDVGLTRWPGASSIGLYLHTGAPPGAPMLFGGEINVPGDDFRGQAAAGDLNGDGRDDIALLEVGAAFVTFQSASPPGGFGPVAPLP